MPFAVCRLVICGNFVFCSGCNFVAIFCFLLRSGFHLAPPRHFFAVISAKFQPYFGHFRHFRRIRGFILMASVKNDDGIKFELLMLPASFALVHRRMHTSMYMVFLLTSHSLQPLPLTPLPQSFQSLFGCHGKAHWMVAKSIGLSCLKETNASGD